MELCNDALRVLSDWQVVNATKTWVRWMSSLTNNLQHNCLDIETKGRMWAPLVFIWPERSWPSRMELQLMFKNQDWDNVWLPALDYTDYGPRGVKSYSLQNYSATQLDRVQHAWVFFAMMQVTGLTFENLGLVLEFGAGTGQMASVLHSLPFFQSLHLVYDMPPMLLMQRHWCRKIGLPVRMFGYDRQNEDAHQCISREQTIQTHQLFDVEQILSRHNACNFVSEGTDALFVATYSFTEADLNTRAQIVHITRNFGRLYLMFAKSPWDGVDTLGYIRHWLSTLRHTHRVCVWAHGARALQMAAARKDIAEPRCRASVGCDDTTFNSNLSVDCRLDD